MQQDFDSRSELKPNVFCFDWPADAIANGVIESDKGLP